MATNDICLDERENDTDRFWDDAREPQGNLLSINDYHDVPLTQKKFRRIINSRKGFITEKFVYERALPLDKPFFLEKTEKGLPYVAK